MKTFLYTIIFCTLSFSIIAQKVIIKDVSDEVLVEIKDEGTGGSIYLPSISFPDTTKQKLYNVNGRLYWDGTQLGFINQAGGWRVSGSNIFQSNLSHRVGIGTSSPIFPLQVEGSSTSEVSLGIHNRNNGGSERLYFGESTNSDAALLVFGPDNTSNSGLFRFLNNKTNGHFDWASGSAIRMVLNDKGWLGIGSSEPAQKLDVDGKMRIADDTTTASAGVMRFNIANNVFEGYNGSTWNAFSGSKWTSNGSNIYYNSGHVSLGTANPAAKLHIVQGTTNDAFRVDDALFDSSPFMIKADGNVGVGTETPESKLHIEGNTPDDVKLLVHNLDDTGSERLYFGPETASDAGLLVFGSANSGNQGKFRFLNNKTNAHFDWVLNSAWRMGINNSGYLGVGTSSQSARLHVSQTQAEDAFRVDDESGDSSPFIIKEDGKVGIGLTAPDYSLHAMASNIDRTGYFEMENDSISFASGVYGSGSGNHPVAGTYGRATGDSTNYGIVGLAFNGDKNYGGNFTTNTMNEDIGYAVYGNATGTGTNYAGYFKEGNVVVENGKLGIGTTNPGATLDVNGSLKVDVTTLYVSDFSNEVGIGTTNPDAKLDVNGSLKVDGSTLNVDDTNNRVGIGTSSPAEKLHVNGTVKLNKVTRSATGSSNLVPLAYGFVHSDADTSYLASSTGNVTVDFEAPGIVRIAVSDFSSTPSNSIIIVTTAWLRRFAFGAPSDAGYPHDFSVLTQDPDYNLMNTPFSFLIYAYDN